MQKTEPSQSPPLRLRPSARRLVACAAFWGLTTAAPIRAAEPSPAPARAPSQAPAQAPAPAPAQAQSQAPAPEASQAPAPEASLAQAPAPEASQAPASGLPTGAPGLARSSLPGPLVQLLPELRTAFEALNAGKVPRARELFDNWLGAHGGSPHAGAVRFLRARCDARLGNASAAEAGYRESAVALPELKDFLQAERARLALRDGRFDEADTLVGALSAQNREYFSLLVERAQREIRRARVTDALTTLGRLTPALSFASERALVSKLLADARLTLTGDRQAWRDRLVDIWRTWPKTDTARDLESTLLAAVADPTIAESPLTLDELVELALRRTAGGGVKAAESIVRALEKRFPRRVVGLNVLLDGQGNVKKRPAVVRQSLTATLPLVVESSIRDGLWELEARSLRQNERYDDALEVYRRIGRDGGSSLRRAVALLEGGRMARRMGRVTHARWFFDRFLARHREFPEARAEGLWNLGWFAWRDGSLDEADNFFRLITIETPDTTDSSGRTYAERATFWRARVLHRRGETATAQLRWTEIERRYPLSYYANLAAAWRRRTGDASEALPRPAANEPMTPPTLVSFTEVEPVAVPALTLVRLGLPEEARQSLRYMHRLGRLGVTGVQLLSALYREDGNESLAHWVVQGGDPLTAAPVKDARGRWLSAFPRPFGEIVAKEAKEHAIDPLIIWAIMRQESGFRSTARSNAKAHGLMQVLLPTARHVAKALLGERQPSLAKVYTPGANVHYGAAYLRHLLDRYKGNPALAFAGYNAGPGAVDKWLKRFGPLDCDEFVEEIPYAEAQGYARKVIRSYAAYTYLYGVDGDPFLSLPLRLPVRGGAVAARN